MRLLAPLRHRDFRLLWSGMCVSLLGDGIFLVAMAWQVYALSNAPTALALVGITMTVPTIAFLLLGGVVSDRFDRRRVMVAADVLRGLAVGLMALLSLTGALELWHIAALAAVYGAGTAFFSPSFDALVPEVLPARRPRRRPTRWTSSCGRSRCAWRGRRWAACSSSVFGAGTAFALDAASFVVSAVALLAMAPRARRAAPAGRGSVTGDIARGPALRPQPRVAVGDVRERRDRLPALHGPGRGAAALHRQERPARHRPPTSASSSPPGGIGSVGCAVVIGQRGLPRRDITFMYVTWTLATLAVAGYGLATAVWQLMLASLAFNALETAGTIVWATAKQRHVPAALLGRVSSLDWLISIGLLPLSFALTGPVSGAIGARNDAHRRRARGRRRHLLGAAPARHARRRGPQKSARPDEHEDDDHRHDGHHEMSARKASSSERSGFSTLRARRPSSTRPPT